MVKFLKKLLITNAFYTLLEILQEDLREKKRLKKEGSEHLCHVPATNALTAGSLRSDIALLV
jgi:hypothetical protein